MGSPPPRRSTSTPWRGAWPSPWPSTGPPWCRPCSWAPGAGGPDRSLLLGLLAVRPRTRGPRQLLWRAYDDQSVTPGQLGHDGVEVAVDVLVADARDHLVGQRPWLSPHFGAERPRLGAREP